MQSQTALVASDGITIRSIHVIQEAKIQVATLKPSSIPHQSITCTPRRVIIEIIIPMTALLRADNRRRSICRLSGPMFILFF